jgi:hypothetical protein
MQVGRRALALFSLLIAVQVARTSAQPPPGAGIQSAVCVFSGPATKLPLVGPVGNQNLDWPSLGSPAYIHIIGCGGGGGGSGAGKAPQDGYGVSGAGGAGADVRTYTYGPITPATTLKVTFSVENGAGGCGGGRGATECAQIPSGHSTYPDSGGSGTDGMTVDIGLFKFEGGEGAQAMDSSGRAHGGRKVYAGGDGAATNIGDAERGKDYKNKHKGGDTGESGNGPGGQGGLRGSGGGASPAGDGGRGGRAGSGDGRSTGAANNAKPGENGGICAGGGGGGAAAAGQFPGGNGGDGGPAWIVIYASSSLSPITQPELETLGQLCGSP